MANELNCEYFFLEPNPLISDYEKWGDVMNIKFSADPSNKVSEDYVTGMDGLPRFLSGRLAEVLKGLKVYGLKIEPTAWAGKQKKRTETFFEFGVSPEGGESWQSYQLDIMDMEKSKFAEKTKKDKRRGLEWTVYDIDKFAIDEKKLKNIPLEKRLIFGLDQAPRYLAFHKNVVEAINAINPTGIKFVPLEGAELPKGHA
jgi:hypothetical protein